MADNKLIGQNYTTPDLVAKVTGKAKYAEDYRVEGMLFCKLLVSPYPHARVTHLDTSAAMAHPGVKAIITADDMPGAAAGATLGEGVQASQISERGLTNEPLYQGEPILALAAVDELSAAEAIEKIDITFEPLPFVVDPIESLRPGGANARQTGNVWMRPSAPPAAPGARGPSNSAGGADAAAPRTPTPTGPAGEQRGAAAGAAGAAAGTAAQGGRPGPPGGAPPRALQPKGAAVDRRRAQRLAVPRAGRADAPREPQRLRRRRRSSPGNGQTTTSRKPVPARCRSARRPTSGCSATSTRR